MCYIFYFLRKLIVMCQKSYFLIKQKITVREILRFKPPSTGRRHHQISYVCLHNLMENKVSEENKIFF